MTGNLLYKHTPLFLTSSLIALEGIMLLPVAVSPLPIPGLGVSFSSLPVLKLIISSHGVLSKVSFIPLPSRFSLSLLFLMKSFPNLAIQSAKAEMSLPQCFPNVDGNSQLASWNQVHGLQNIQAGCILWTFVLVHICWCVLRCDEKCVAYCGFESEKCEKLGLRGWGYGVGKEDGTPSS